MELKDLLAFDQGVAIIMKEKIDFKLAYRLTKIVKKMEPELKAFKSAQLKLIEKYGEKNKQGKMAIPNKNVKAFDKDSETMLKEKVEVDFEPIPLDLIEKQEKIETEVLIKLYLFLDNKEETPIKEKND